MNPSLSHLGVQDENHNEPEVGKDGEEGGDEEDREVPDPSDLPIGDPGDADGGDGEEVEGGRAHDGAGTELVRLKVVPDNSNDGQHDLGRRGT